MNALELQGLSKIYRGKKRAVVTALEGLNLTVAPGEVFGFLGPNGAGKSTTIKAIVGLLTLSSGSISIFGHDHSAAAARKAMGFLPENPALYEFLTAEEYLRFVGVTFKMEESLLARRIGEVLHLVGLTEARNRQIRSYSKGMVQRLGIGQALIHDPDLYIFDEPMSGLDPLGRALVKDIILDLKQRGKTVFFSTHITSDVERVCDRVGIIVKGRLRAVHDVADLLEQGIEGYMVQVTGARRELLEQYHGVTVPGAQELFIPRDRFSQFVKELADSGGDIRLIEPRRHDLESFFLDIVGRENVTVG